jgi:hypothetical protein
MRPIQCTEPLHQHGRFKMKSGDSNIRNSNTISAGAKLFLLMAALLGFKTAFAQERGDPAASTVVTERFGVSEKKISNTHFVFEAHGSYGCQALKISNAVDCEKSVYKRLLASVENACAKKGYHPSPGKRLWTHQTTSKPGYGNNLVIGNGVAIDCRDTVSPLSNEGVSDR